MGIVKKGGVELTSQDRIDFRDGIGISDEFLPTIRPTLDLDFVNGATVDPRITFTRASTTTYYDGKTFAKAEENLLLQSQTFDGANWLKLNANVTADAGVAPDGTSTADKIAETAATGFHGLVQPLTGYVGQTVTFSVYLKAVERTWALVWFDSDSAGAYYDLSTGALGTVSAGVTASPGVAVGNGWYRCAITRTITSGANPRVFTATGNNTANYAGTDGSGVLIWGAQIEARSQATAYTPTTTQPITRYQPQLLTAPANTAVIDHDPVTGARLGLRVWEARTNLMLQSEFATGLTGFSASGGLELSTMFGPAGGIVNAAYFAPGSVRFGYKGKVPVSTVCTLSVFVKMDDGSAPVFGSPAAANAANDFCLVLSGGAQNPTAYTVAHVGNGLYRVSATITTGTTGLGNNGLVKYGTNSARGFRTTGWMLEAGSSASPYIPTTTAQVTRAADVASMTGANFSSWYRQDEGTLVADCTPVTLSSGAGISANDGTANNRIRLAAVSTTEQGTVSVGGVNQAVMDGGTPEAGSRAIMAMSYRNNDFALSMNGGAAVTDALGVVPFVDRLRIGGETTTPGNLHIRHIAYYPARLSDATLQAITKP